MQSGSYKVTARPASTTRCCTGRQTTDQQPGHPNRGVSRKQESGHLPAPAILTVVAVAAKRGAEVGVVVVVDAGAVLGPTVRAERRLPATAGMAGLAGATGGVHGAE